MDESVLEQPKRDPAKPTTKECPPFVGYRSWIFVSHSHKDFEAVRKVRNALEERGHFPLLFFLRCLTDESELESLLRREIEARDFFLLCNSENAADSRFVAEEVNYIKSLAGKIYETVDLDSNWEAQIEAIKALSRRATVYLSYSAGDYATAGDVAAALAQRDFKIEGLDHSLKAGDEPRAAAERGILEALEYGFVIVLLSSSAVSRPVSFQWLELHITNELSMRFAPGRVRVIPVIWSDYEAVTQWMEANDLDRIHPLDLSRVDRNERADRIVEFLLEAARGDG